MEESREAEVWRAGWELACGRTVPDGCGSGCVVVRGMWLCLSEAARAARDRYSMRAERASGCIRAWHDTSYVGGRGG